VEKVYVARVLGVFPAAPVRLDLALAWNPRTNHVTAVPAGPRVGGASPAPACGGGGGGGGGGDEGRAASSDARAAQPSTLDERPGACASCEPGLPAASRGCCNADGSGVGRRCACQPGGTAARGEVAGGACVGPVADMGDPAGQASAADAGDADADEAARDGRNEGARGGLPGDARGDLAAARAQRKRERAARSAAAADRRAAAHAAVTVRVAAAAAAEAAGFDPAAAAKPALSVFRRLAVAPDGRTSVVECRRALIPSLSTPPLGLWRSACVAASLRTPWGVMRMEGLPVAERCALATPARDGHLRGRTLRCLRCSGRPPDLLPTQNASAGISITRRAPFRPCMRCAPAQRDGLLVTRGRRPRTGRTHQLRVHLQALGHPIANDVQYGGPFPGPDRHRSWLAGDAEPAAAGLGVGAAHVVPPGPGESACAAAGGAAAPGDCAAAAPGAPAAALCGACDGAAHAAAGSAARAGGGGHAAAAAAAPAGARGDEPAAAAAGPPAGGGAAPEPGPGAAQPAGRSTESAPAAVLAQAAWLGGEHGTGGCAGARDSARAGERGVRAGAAPAAAAAALAAEDAGREQSARPDAGQGAASCNPDPGADPEGPHMEGRRAARGAPAGPAAEPGGLLPVLERAACDPMCPHCPSVALEGYPVPPRPLWLHARRYACADWAFECPLPAWAEPGFAPSVE
jgi:hypothetical protein